MWHIKALSLTVIFYLAAINGSCQKKDCFELCYHKRSIDYSLEKQKIDYLDLSKSYSIKDSIKILKRIISYNCNSKIGQKAKTILDKVIIEKFKLFYGEWKFEWSGSNWGTGEVDSLKTGKKIIIREHKIEFIQKGKTKNKAFEILCVGLDYKDDLYFMIKINSIIWQFYLEENLNRNVFARIDTPDKLKKKNQFIYLRQYGLVCGNMEKYYSKNEEKQN